MMTETKFSLLTGLALLLIHVGFNQLNKEFVGIKQLLEGDSGFPK